MAPIMHQLQPRGIPTIGVPAAVYDLIVALLIIISLSLVSLGILLIIRRVRQNKRKQTADSEQHNTKPSASTSRRPSLFFSSRDEKGVYSATIPTSSKMPLPEIRIHLSDEIDESGQQAPGRIVVVRFDSEDSTTPYVDHHDLPPYRPLRDPRAGQEMREKY